MLTVNPYCKDWGWLFEDLKATLENVDIPGVRVAASSEPLPGADVWVALRAGEALASPDKDRTIVQWHDYREHSAVWQQLRDFGALQCVHPSQVPMAPPARRVDTCRIGYRELFTLRAECAKRPTIGWVGRDVTWQGRHIKQPEIFVDLANGLRTKIPALRAMMYGPLSGQGNILPYASRCQADACDGDRAYSLRDFYHCLDALVVTCEPEPGPLTIYEALACGVPVVTLPTGAADATGSPNAMLVAEDEADLFRLTAELLRFPARFQNRYMIAKSVEGVTQERWAKFTIALAEIVAGG